MSEQTLSIIKPDAVKSNNTGAILQKIQENGLKIKAMKMLKLSREEASQFYAVHSERPFYQDLIDFMTSGSVVVSVLESDSAVSKYRDLMGVTNPKEAKEGTLRKLFATNIEKNAVHGSDSLDNAKIEISFFFAKKEVNI